MKKVFILWIILSGFGTIHAQNKIAGYEYWFNSDVTTKHVTSVLPVQQLNLNLSIPTANLFPGLHSINFRSKDNAGMWSTTLSQFFYKVPQTISSIPNVVAYQYWFNSDYTTAVTLNTPVGEIVNVNQLLNVQTLKNGLHTYNIRFKDNAGMWSSTLSQFFYKVPQTISSIPNVVAYQYWFNSDYSTAVTLNTPVGEIVNADQLLNVQTLKNGLHTYNIRFKDNAGMWSSTLSQFFYKVPQTAITQNLIIAYRYWFNDSFDQASNNSVTTPVQTLNVINNINLSGIPNGKHAIHFQFKDMLGMWSVVTSDSINMMSTVNIPENSFENCIAVYPNPTNGKVYIDLGSVLHETEVTIMDAKGKLVKQSIYNNLQTIELNISEPPGIYLITITSEDKRKTLRLIKK